MSHLNFCAKSALTLAKHSFENKEHRTLFESPSGPGLFLVGDSGVYLQSTGAENLPDTEKNKPNLVVYAEGCDPDKDEDDWWKNKANTFGGSDGVEYLPFTENDIALLEKCHAITITFNANDTMTVKFVKNNVTKH